MISITHLKALWDPQSSIRVKRSSEAKKLESTDLEPASLDGACVCLRKDASSGWTEPIPGARSGQGRAGWIPSLFLPLAGCFETCTNFPTVHRDPVFLGCPNWCPRLQLASSGSSCPALLDCSSYNFVHITVQPQGPQWFPLPSGCISSFLMWPWMSSTIWLSLVLPALFPGAPWHKLSAMVQLCFPCFHSPVSNRPSNFSLVTPSTSP